MTTSPVTLVSVNISQPRTMGDPGTRDPRYKQWRSGIFKFPIDGPARVGRLNIEGDGQADLSVHGGADKALLAYSAEHYPRWNDELAEMWHERDDRPSGSDVMGPGAFGENLTFTGITEETVCIGDVWRIGDLRVQVSQPRQPCWKLARRWELPQLPQLVVKTGRSGWYCRVLREGMVEAGLACELLERPYPRWTILRANRALFDKRFPVDDARELAGVPELADGWKEDLIGVINSPTRR